MRDERYWIGMAGELLVLSERQREATLNELDPRVAAAMRVIMDQLERAALASAGTS